MDRNFHNDDFERLLREKSDEFRMYPSKRIWNSIYNNIHPGRKWPSVAMSITLIITLLSVGYLNTRNASLYPEKGTNNSLQKSAPQTVQPQFTSTIIVDNNSNLKYATNSGEKKEPVTGAYKNLTNSKNTKTFKSVAPVVFAAAREHDSSVNADNLVNDKTSQSPQHSTLQTKNESNNPWAAAKDIPFAPSVNAVITADILSDHITENTPTFTDNSGETSINNSIVQKVIVRDLATSEIIIPVKASHSDPIVANLNPDLTNKNLNAAEDKEWIENYALYNRPVPKRWVNKLSWQLYATPSIVYRSLYNDPHFQNTFNATPLAISASSQNIDEAVVHKPSIGLEMGTGIQYSILRGVKLKAGLQLNYTRYNSIAFENSHPVATKLTMHDFTLNTSYEVYRTTPYSNKNGLEVVKLHNQTFQVSLPVGVDIRLAANESIQWNVGATIQPTYVVGGKSYLISSDRRNYVRETSMLNKWNLNAGFETFISFKANGLTWQIGPQVRTQLFTTNSRKFAVEEKIVNYGLKVGVSKTIR